MRVQNNILILTTLIAGFFVSSCGTRDYASSEEQLEKEEEERKQIKVVLPAPIKVEPSTPIEGAPAHFGMEYPDRDERRDFASVTGEVRSGWLMDEVVDPMGSMLGKDWKEDLRDSESPVLFVPIGLSAVAGGAGLLLFRWTWSLPVKNLKLLRRSGQNSSEMPPEHSSRHPHPKPTDAMHGQGHGYAPTDLYPDRMSEKRLLAQGFIGSSLKAAAKGAAGGCVLYLGLASSLGLGADYEAAAAATVVGASTTLGAYGALWRPLATDWSQTRGGRFVHRHSPITRRIHDLSESNRLAYITRRSFIPSAGAGVAGWLVTPYVYQQLQEELPPWEDFDDSDEYFEYEEYDY